MASGAGGLLTGVLARIGPRRLAWVFGALFVVNLLVPDPIPIVDELLLGLLTLILAQWRSAPPEEPSQSGGQPGGQSGDPGIKPPMKNVTPKEDPRRSDP
jgi:hypothetical protein